MKVQVAHESSPMVGELANGDRAIFRTDERERTLLAIVDVLGHGPGAADVAKVAAERLQTITLDTSVLEVMRDLHGRLQGTRGAAATICILREDELEACAVGNVELRSFDLRVPLVCTAGIIGVRIAKYHTCRAQLRKNARLVMFSDGISSRTPLDNMRTLSPAAACAEIMRKHRRKEDDATVLIADLG